MIEQPTPSVTFSSEDGAIRVREDWMSSPQLEELLASLRSEAADPEAVRVGVVKWAGPFDYYIAIVDTVAALGGLTGGVAGLLALFARKHPESTVNVTINGDVNYTVPSTGEVPKGGLDAINEALGARTIELEAIRSRGAVPQALFRSPEISE